MSSATVAPAARAQLAALVAEHGQILLYDGVCGLCDSSVQFILQHDRKGTMRFATLQSELGLAALDEYPSLRGVDSVVLLQPGSASVRSTAVLQVARYLGGIWALLALPGWLLPRGVRDAMYDFVARNRYRVFGKLDACRLPTPEERARFLEAA